MFESDKFLCVLILDKALLSLPIDHSFNTGSDSDKLLGTPHNATLINFSYLSNSV